MEVFRPSLMASHQFLLSGEVYVMTPITTSDKSDEALVKVVRFSWSLKPFDINLCWVRWMETVSEGQTGEGASEWKDKTKSIDGLDMTDQSGFEGREKSLMISICLGKLGALRFRNTGKQTDTWFADCYLAQCVYCIYEALPLKQLVSHASRSV